MSERVWIVDAEAAGTRLDKWLAGPGRAGSRSRALDALHRGRVFVNTVEQGPEAVARRLAAGDRVRYWIDRPGSASRRTALRTSDLAIVFEDDVLVVVDKPPGLLTVPLDDQPDAVSLQHLVALHWRSHGRRRPLVVHRIDRDTSGLVIFAKTPAAWRALKAQFAHREPERTYYAVVEGAPAYDRGTWKDWLWWDASALVQRAAEDGRRGAVEAETRYRVVRRLREATVVEFQLVTGRQHQVRAQASLHGYPLVGERTYRTGGQRPRVDFGRQALHAQRLAFTHPVANRLMSFDAPVPKDLRRLVAALAGGGEAPRRGRSRLDGDAGGGTRA